MNEVRISIHRGIDIKGNAGLQVRAANRGMVVLSDELFFGGNTLVIDHGYGIYSLYMHLSGFNVHTGNFVERGDVVGYVGSTGRSTGPHLHFGLKVGGTSVNPVSIINSSLF